jgi:hypothetical protein
MKISEKDLEGNKKYSLILEIDSTNLVVVVVVVVVVVEIWLAK